MSDHPRPPGLAELIKEMELEPLTICHGDRFDTHIFEWPRRNALTRHSQTILVRIFPDLSWSLALACPLPANDPGNAAQQMRMTALSLRDQ